MPHATDDTPIPLRGGFVVRTSVMTWLLDASLRLHFRIGDDGRLDVWPRRAITPDDDHILRTYRDEIIAAVRYCDEQAEAPT